MDRMIRLLGSSPERLALLAALVLAMFAAGCTPKIGDKCVLSTDCSQQGTLVCDTSLPGGYCTQLNCNFDSCPNYAICVEFQASVPGCAYDDYMSPSRTGRSFCMAHCSQDSDCRESDGYTCKDPTKAPWNGAILSNNQSQGVCIAAAGLQETAPMPDAAVCRQYPFLGPDAATDAGDASSEGLADGEADGEVDAPSEAAPDVVDAGVDAALDAAFDATIEPTDAGSADAAGGG